MGVSMQGGHQGRSDAFAGDNINANAVSYGGPVQIGNIMTGNKEQTPTTSFGGSTSTSGFSADLSGLGDLMGKGKGGEKKELVLLQLYA